MKQHSTDVNRKDFHIIPLGQLRNVMRALNFDSPGRAYRRKERFSHAIRCVSSDVL